jgi:caffeoyl-CoA O-methyltransferase
VSKLEVRVSLVKHLTITPEVQEYVTKYGTAQDDVLQWIVERTQEFGSYAIQQIVPEQGALITLLTRLINARFAVEVGTFTGYSSLCIARGLPADGRLLCCDNNANWTSVAQEAWRKAGVEDKVKLVLAPAVDTLRGLPAEPPIDLSFIDADLSRHGDYYDELIGRTRPNGVIVIDNTLIRGQVADPVTTNENAIAVHRFNTALAMDNRVDVVILPFHDGVTLARKR